MLDYCFDADSVRVVFVPAPISSVFKPRLITSRNKFIDEYIFSEVPDKLR